MKKRLLRTGMVMLLAVGLLLGMSQTSSFAEFRTIHSLKKISDRPVYELTYYNDDQFQKYMQSDIKDEADIIQFWKENVTHGQGEINSLGEQMCSAFYARTPEGDYIFARNLDSKEAVPGIIRMKKEGSANSLSISALSWCGWNVGDENKTYQEKQVILTAPYESLDGVNEYGVAIANFTSRGNRKKTIEGKPTLYDDQVIRYVLDNAKSTDEAIALIQDVNILFSSGNPSHYMIADSSGRSVVVEFINGEMQVIEGENGYQAVSNFNLYNNPKNRGFGAGRYQSYCDYLNENGGIITEEDALLLLKENTIFAQEQWSVVYNLNKKTMKVIFSNDNQVYEYQL